MNYNSAHVLVELEIIKSYFCFSRLSKNFNPKLFIVLKIGHCVTLITKSIQCKTLPTRGQLFFKKTYAPIN